jgi:uncharacterized protein
MLIEFVITNFRSFRDEQRFSLVAAADKSLSENTLIVPGFKYRLLRSAVIYGPNASGKSNLILAMGFLHLLILGAVQSAPTPGRRMLDHPLLKPFLLDNASATTPTSFELSFFNGGIRHQYGIVLDRNLIREEWLIVYPKGQPQTWFTRKLRAEDPGEFGAFTVSDPDLYEWYFGPRLSGEKQRLADLTRADVPFLSAGATFGNQQLRQVFDWFAQQLSVLNPWGRPDLAGETAKQTLEDEQLRTMLRDLLAHADFGIEDFRVQEVSLKNDLLARMLPEHIPSAIENIDITHTNIFFRHRGGAALPQSVEFERDDESLGTIRFFGIAGPVIDALRHGKTLLVDEFDDSLHPLLVQRLVELFHSPVTNPHNAQLVINTHDVTMLDTALFRRDQIWFTEKGSDGASRLVPLSDYSPRKNESLMRGYLYGRYGAVPFLDQLPTLRLSTTEQPATAALAEGQPDG